MVVDLLAGKQRFATLMDDIQPMIISQFIIWLDEKVAEFKVQGCMNLDMGTEAPRWVKDYSMSVLVSGTSILGQDPATPTHRLSESVNLAPSRTSTARPSRIHVLSPVSDKSKHIDNQNSRHFSQSMPTRQKRLPSVDDDDDDDDDDLVVVSVKKEKMDSYECNDFTGAVMPYLSSNSPHKQRRLSGSASAVVPSQITSQKQRPFTSIRKSFHPDAQSPRATPAASSSSIDHAWPSAEQSSGDDTSCERSEPQLEMSVVNVKEASDPVQTLDDTSHSQGWSYDEASDLKPNTGALELYSRMSPLESSAVSASGDDSVIQPLSLSSSLSLPIEPSTSGVGQSDEAFSIVLSDPYFTYNIGSTFVSGDQEQCYKRHQVITGPNDGLYMPSITIQQQKQQRKRRVMMTPRKKGRRPLQPSAETILNHRRRYSKEQVEDAKRMRMISKEFDEEFKSKQRERKRKSVNKQRTIQQAQLAMFPEASEQQYSPVVLTYSNVCDSGASADQLSIDNL